VSVAVITDDQTQTVTGPTGSNCSEQNAAQYGMSVSNDWQGKKDKKGGKRQKVSIRLAGDGIVLELLRRKKNLLKHISTLSPIPAAVLSKASVCGRSLAGIAGSNPAEGMDVCCECCVVR
jgi:hypothetical protein